MIPLSPEICIESTRLPDGYNTRNSDPGDQIIVATARVEDLALMSLDSKITPYSHVKLWKPG